MSNKAFRTGNGLFDTSVRAHGRAADSIRGAIRWNEVREKSARKAGRLDDAARHAGNQVIGQLSLLRMAQEQSS